MCIRDSPHPTRRGVPVPAAVLAVGARHGRRQAVTASQIDREERRPPMRQLSAPVLFGAAYYHEYQPSPRLEQDLDLMVAAGFSVIRVGESTWSTWEPEDGVLELEWLAPVVDGAHDRGIHCLLYTSPSPRD